MALNKQFAKLPSFGEDDFVGTIKTGEQINGRPVALSEFRVVSDDPNVCKALAEKFNGEVSTFQSMNGAEKHQVHNLGETIDIVLLTIKSRFALKDNNNQVIRSCSGEQQYDEKKSSCVCPSDVREMKQKADSCKPDIFAVCRFKGLEELGKFRFYSGSWNLAEQVNAVEQDLEAAGGEADAEFSIVQVSYQTKQGQNRSFSKPSIKVLAPVS
jgi:hypothetical protein